MTNKAAAASDPNARSTRQSPAPETQANTSSSTTPSTTTARPESAEATPKGSIAPAERLRIEQAAREKLQREQAASGRSQPTRALPTEIRAKFEALQAERNGTANADDDTNKASATGAADQNSPSTDATETNLSRAKEALRRSGLWTPDEIETMSREDVLRRGRRLQRQTSRQAASQGDNSTPRSGAAASAANQTPQATGQTPTNSGTAMPAAVEALKRRFEAAGQKELGEAVGEFLATVSTHANPQQGALTPQGGQTGVTDAQIVTELRGEMSERFPDLANDDDFEELGEVANQLMQTRPFALAATASPAERKAMFRRATEHAAAMLDFEDIGGGSPAANTRRAGRATLPNATTRQKVSDPVKAARAVFEGLQSGQDLPTARRRAGLA
jgi:hypothetical protein